MRYRTKTQMELNAEAQRIDDTLTAVPPATRSATCPGCGKRVRICIPWGGDGSVDVYFRHRLPSGAQCEYSRSEVKSSNAPAHRPEATKPL